MFPQETIFKQLYFYLSVCEQMFLFYTQLECAGALKWWLLKNV